MLLRALRSQFRNKEKGLRGKVSGLRGEVSDLGLLGAPNGGEGVRLFACCGVNDASGVQFVTPDFTCGVQDVCPRQQDADMDDGTFLVCEKGQITPVGFNQRNFLPCSHLLRRIPGQLEAHDTERKLHQPGTVDSESRTSTPQIGNPEEAFSCRHRVDRRIQISRSGVDPLKKLIAQKVPIAVGSQTKSAAHREPALSTVTVPLPT